jgi:hypothetical protein
LFATPYFADYALPLGNQFDQLSVYRGKFASKLVQFHRFRLQRLLGNSFPVLQDSDEPEQAQPRCPRSVNRANISASREF